MYSKIITVFISYLILTCTLLQAQEQKKLTGIIKDTYGDSLSEVTISIKENNQETKADTDGRFEIIIPQNSFFTLQFTHKGYVSIEKPIDINKDSIENIVINMEQTDEKFTGLREVIITAEKRETKLQQTPISVSAISSKEIEQRKMTEMTDMVMSVPNLISMTGGSPTLNFMSIRGILTFSTDPTIGIYIDGVPMFDGYASSVQLQDIQRIEILRGPQSTLYGRNALGGVINILTKQPDNTLKSFVEMGVSNYNTHEFRVGISAPLIKNKLFTSFNAFYTDRKGVFSNKYTNRHFDNYKNYGGNFTLKYLINDELSIIINSKLEKNDLMGAFPYAANVESALSSPYKIDQNGKNQENRLLSIMSLQVKYQTKQWEISSLTGYTYLNDKYIDYDQDYSPYDIMSWYAPKRPQNTWTQELRAVSKNLGKWEVTGGIFGFLDNRQSNTETVYGKDAISLDPNAPYSYYSFSKQKGKGFASYVNVGYSFTPKLKLTAGLRYDYDEKELTLHNEFQKDPSPILVYPTNSVTTSDNAWSPKVNLSYLLKENITLYVNYARGFRPGGVNPYANEGSTNLTFEPEYTDNYEAGIKTEWLQQRLRANLAFFYTYWKDQQQTLMVPENRIANIGEMYSRGVELELTALPLKNLQINYNFGIIDTHYDKLILLNEEGTANTDYKGNKQIFTPAVSFGLSISYTGKIAEDLNFFIVPEWKFLGKQYMTYYNDLTQKPFHLLNLNLGIKYKKYELKFWAKNITDSRYISFVYANYRGYNSPVSLALPATYGTSIKVNF